MLLIYHVAISFLRNIFIGQSHSHFITEKPFINQKVDHYFKYEIILKFEFSTKKKKKKSLECYATVQEAGTLLTINAEQTGMSH